MNDDLSNLSMMELFRVEVESQTAILTGSLLELERGAGNTELGTRNSELLESLMRAAHSLKGAGRIVNLRDVVQVAHAMEDCFVAAQKGKLRLRQAEIDVLLRGVDLIAQLAKRGETAAAPGAAPDPATQRFVEAVDAFMTGANAEKLKAESGNEFQLSAFPISDFPQEVVAAVEDPSQQAVQKPDAEDRVLRLTAENLNRLLGLAGESLVESRWLRPFSESMQRLKRMHSDTEDALDGFRQSLDDVELPEQSQAKLEDVFNRAGESRHFLNDRLQELDLFDRRSAHLSNRLYLEVLRARMRPFGDGVRQFPRMVRDVARSLGKYVRFDIIGENTQVDRDILDRLEAPLAHLLRNALDHGCEPTDERVRAGKTPEASIRLEARHSAGALVIIVSDDGAGVDTERIRKSIVQKNLTAAALAEKMTDSELLEFLFLPGFTMKETVTEISGRGVGLDIVQNLARSVRGSVHVGTQKGRGTKFQLQLPLTLSVLRTLLVEIGGEPYAIPLVQITNALKCPREKIESLEGRHHFTYRDQQIGLLSAHQVLDLENAEGSRLKAKNNFSFQPLAFSNSALSVVVLGERGVHYGLVVDRFLGERELVVQPLDPRLGKVKDISAAALMEDGSPILIVDVDDTLRSIEKLISSGALTNIRREVLEATTRKRKRVLVVDDSLTVRELERKLLAGRGYEADVAVDGMDGWNAVRNGHYDLVITDVDMPRMDGIELATFIKKDPHLKSLPVMIVSYKDREEDRMRGLDAGADYYLTKGSFHDETLLKAVEDLIGEPES